MRISPSAYLKYRTCGRQYWYHYSQGLRTYKTKVQLLFGRAVHQALADFLKAWVYGKHIDIVLAFEEAFYREAHEVIVTESARWDFESLMATGRVLVEAFPAVWHETGLAPVIDDHGPVVERKLEARIPGTRDVIFGIIDLVAMDCNGLVYLLDHKTPASSSDNAIHMLSSPEVLSFASTSDQLTFYQVLAEANKHSLGIERVNKLGFWELVKRKVNGSKGPEVMPPQIVDRRSPKAVNDLLQGINYMADDVRNRRFPKHTGSDYNSPCKMCEFAQLCITGDDTGLVSEKRMHAHAQPNRYKQVFALN